MFRITPVSFIFDFSNEESIEAEMKKFIQFYWEDKNKAEKD